MKTTSFAIAVLASIAGTFLGSCVDDRRTISGEVFWVLGVGEPFKLGLVTVCAYDCDEMQRHVAAKKEESDAHLAELGTLPEQAADLRDKAAAALASADYHDQERASRMIAAVPRTKDLADHAAAALQYYQSAQFVMQNLPKPIASAKTDSEGRYALTVPKGRRIVIGAGTYYDQLHYSMYWLVDPGEQSTVKLANDNAAGSVHHGSLLPTQGMFREHTVISTDSMKDSLKELADLVNRPGASETALAPKSTVTPVPEIVMKPVPRIVTLIQPVPVKLSYGSATLPCGARFEIFSRSGATVKVKYGDSVQEIPITATDLK